MMRARLASIGEAIDVFLQRRFDALFFAIMRLTGCGKRQIRWNLWLGFIVPVLTRLMPWNVRKYLWLAWPLALGVASLFIVVYGVWMQREHDWDVEAERRGMMSHADRPSNARACKTLGWYYVNIATWLFLPVYLVKGQADFERLLDLIAGIAMLAQGYLCNTPPTPPPKPQTVLAPQLEGAS